MTGAILDAGALLAYERSNRRVVVLLKRAVERGEPLVVPAGVVGQVWRNGRRQARLARLLASETCEVVDLDDHNARAAGQLCGVARTTDVIDASVVVLSRQRSMRVLTSDAGDLRRLDPRIEVVAV